MVSIVTNVSMSRRWYQDDDDENDADADRQLASAVGSQLIQSPHSHDHDVRDVLLCCGLSTTSPQKSMKFDSLPSSVSRIRTFNPPTATPSSQQQPHVGMNHARCREADACAQRGKIEQKSELLLASSLGMVAPELT
jgi:hypothetical protein